jgi:uncharacterized protein
MSDQVTAIVRARVLPINVDDYRRATLELSAQCNGFSGYCGTRIVEPRNEGDEWVTIFSFNNYENYETWINSEDRSQGVKVLDSLADGETAREQIHGLHYWFEPDTKAGRSWPPSWRMAAVAFVAIFPLSFYLAPAVRNQMPNHPLVASVLAIASVTCVMSYVSLPLAVRIFRRWL